MTRTASASSTNPSPADRPRRRRVTRVAGAALAAVVASTLAPAAVLPAQAAVAGMSGVDHQNGYPTWFSDGTVKLQFCYMANAGCLSEPPDPDAPASYPDNFPEEAFWFNAEATGGKLGLYEAALEGAHLNGAVVPGEQMGFGRLRFRVNNLVAGASYTIRHPYGTNTFVAARQTDGTGRINTTIDAGTCAPTTTRPCDWAGVGEAFLGSNAATTTSTFLRQTTSSPGTIGDIGTARPVTGAPSGLNAVEITGPDVGGAGINTLTVRNFTVQGLIFDGADAAPTTPDLAAASDSGRSTSDNITNAATPTFTGSVPGLGAANESSVELMVDGAVVGGATTVNGAYSLEPTTALAAGVHRVQVRTPNPAFAVNPDTGAPLDPAVPPFFTSGTLTFTVDTAPPAAAISTPRPSNPSADTTPTVPFTTEAGATAECQLLPSNIDWSPCTSPMTYDQQLNGNYTFNVRATDVAGNVSTPAAYTWRIGPADIAAPTAPGAPRAVAAGANGMTVSWTAATDDTGVVRYDVYRDGATTPTGSSTTTSFTDSGLAEATSHNYVVRAVDAAGNVSSVSATATGRTADVTAPSLPTGVSATAASTTSMTVRWTAASDNVGVTRYEIYADGATTPTGTATGTTFTHSGLTAGSTHTYRVAAVDAAGNASAQTTAVSGTTTAAPTDTVAPTQTHSPATGATGVAVANNITATFSEAVQGVSGTTFTLRPTSGTTAVTAAVTYDPATRVATLNPTANLAAGTSYTATLTGGAAGIRDLANNQLTATSQTWSFTTAAAAPTDITAPTMTASSPASAATGVAIGTTTARTPVTATFSENVTGVSGTTFTLKQGTTAVPATVTYNATTRVATLMPSAPLVTDRTYTASLTAGIRDAAGNALTARSWNFITGTRPTITTKTPASGATGVSAAGNVTATFSEAVTGVAAGTFRITNPAGTVIPAAVTYNATTRVATIDPTANLVNDTKYTVTATGGATAIRDAAGNTLSSTGASWTFTTGPAPTVTARTPGVSALNVSRTANVTATFSEAVTGWSTTTATLRNATTGVVQTAVVSYNATTRVLTINPSATLAANTRFTATLSTGIRDAAGNPIPTTTWSFTTGAV